MLVAFLLFAGIAQAEFSPALSALLATFPGGNTATVLIGGDINAYGRLTAGSLAAVNSLLSRLELRFLLGSDPACEVSLDGQTMLSVPVSGAGDSALLVIARTLLLNPEEMARRALREVGAALESWKIEDRLSLAIKNTGTASGRIIYTLSAEEWNTVLPAVMAALRQVAADALAGSPGIAAAADDYLSKLTAESKCTLKRFTLPDGSDLGMEFTGKVSYAGQDKRNVTVYCGYLEGKGIYASIKCPAVKGKNSFTFSLSGKLQSAEGRNTFTGSLSVAMITDSEKYRFTGELSLVNLVTTQGERITGSITADTMRTLSGVTDKNRYTLKPDLMITAKAMSGTVLLNTSSDRGLPAKVMLEVSLSAGGIKAALPADVGQVFSGILIDWFMKLPEDHALLLLHELAGESWLNGETLSLHIDSPWVVETEDVP